MTHELTAEVRRRFPLAYQDADDNLGTPLLRWLSLLWDQVGDVADTADSLAPEDGTVSALVDPARAADSWLPWLGQLLGFSFPTTMPPASMRAALNSFTFHRGTTGAIITAASRYMKPAPLVTVTRVDEWHLTIKIYPAQIIGDTYGDLKDSYATYSALKAAYSTYRAYAPQTANLEAAVLAEKPAGVVITFDYSGATYSDLRHAEATYSASKAAFSTYAALKAFVP